MSANNNAEDCVDIPDIEFSLRFVEVDVAETHLSMGNPIYYFGLCAKSGWKPQARQDA